MVSFRMRPPVVNNIDSRIILQGIHVELTDAMQSVMRGKFEALLRHNEYIVRINVRLHQDQKLGTERHYSATAQIEIGGPDLIASADGKEAYEVIDELVEKLDRQLKSRHGRRKDKRNHPHAPELNAPLPKVG
jgi:putative sigma-54 modulation protein